MLAASVKSSFGSGILAGSAESFISLFSSFFSRDLGTAFGQRTVRSARNSSLACVTLLCKSTDCAWPASDSGSAAISDLESSIVLFAIAIPSRITLRSFASSNLFFSRVAALMRTASFLISAFLSFQKEGKKDALERNMTIVEQQVFLGRLDDSGPFDVNVDASLAIILLVGLWVVFFFLSGPCRTRSGPKWFCGFRRCQ